MVCVCFLGLLYACGTNKTNFNNNKMSDWSKYDVGRVDFQNLAPETEGAKLYARIVPKPERFVGSVCCRGESTSIKTKNQKALICAAGI